ncbi:MAG: hypothetical protein L0K86_08200 [Actinomycetia bacterium]|nr:hypothetical protein [Actinomycetes bacterium]
MAVAHTSGVAPSSARVSHALNAILATILIALGIAAAAYRIAVGEPSPGNPYLVLIIGCTVLIGFTALAEIGYHTEYRWARAATCIAWMGAWPMVFIGFTLMIVDGAAATLAFATCIGAALTGLAAVGEDSLPRG